MLKHITFWTLNKLHKYARLHHHSHCILQKVAFRTDPRNIIIIFSTVSIHITVAYGCTCIVCAYYSACVRARLKLAGAPANWICWLLFRCRCHAWVRNMERPNAHGTLAHRRLNSYQLNMPMSDIKKICKAPNKTNPLCQSPYIKWVTCIFE